MTLESLRAEVDGPRMMQDLAGLAQWVKLSGTPEEMEGIRFLQARLDAAGYRTQVLLHDAYISLPGPARVEVDGAPLTAITHSMSRASGPNGVNGPLVDLGTGEAARFAGANLRGALLLVRGIASPDVALRASRAGAAGVLHVSPHEHLHEMCISPVWGNPGLETVADLPSVTVCTISEADGEALAARLAKGDAPRVTLHAKVDTGWRQTPILVGELDAPRGDAGAPFILLSGHQDTWYHGVMDNGSANIGMLEVARLCATRRAEWRRGLRVCFWSGHSHGRYSSSAWYADRNWAELERRCAAHVNVDSLGGIGADVLSDAGCMAPLNALAADAISAVSGQVHAGRRKNRNSDESFPGIGIPSIFGSISMQPAQPDGFRNALGWWWHTPQDLLDKVDEANQVRDTQILLHATWRLLADPVLPLDHAVQADALLEELQGLAPRLADQLPVAEVLAAATRLRDRLARLAASPAEDAATRNRLLMRLSRVLVPLDYVAGDRLAHDPALPQPPWPVLSPLRSLAEAEPGSDAARFATVSAMRACNRLTRALAEAEAVLDAG
ncbi:M28 family peptidase [Pseudoroseomonas wenyumeiae]|uniref:M28 family peptidase n=2 Tax=Teichococcus wenyumeiae TaxID=2478470 RepID=A0A3A9JPB7_9PROT|nr:M28 family peptidase [Pseudoroseomonas wenyumeiae]RMI25164.1 M28 family peptidase [Pseudoroseomonas wenyumeiae]